MFEKSLFKKDFKTLFDAQDQKQGHDSADVPSDDSCSSGDELKQATPRTAQAGIRRPRNSSAEEGRENKKSKHGEEAAEPKHGEKAAQEADKDVDDADLQLEGHGPLSKSY